MPLVAHRALPSLLALCSEVPLCSLETGLAREARLTPRPALSLLGEGQRHVAAVSLLPEVASLPLHAVLATETNDRGSVQKALWLSGSGWVCVQLLDWYRALRFSYFVFFGSNQRKDIV
jgi:hypothetical protein